MLLGLTIDDCLTFTDHIDTMWYIIKIDTLLKKHDQKLS